jgi:xylulose-5-phosphate/fructose-6-phosphate phosphoketolase
MDHVANKKSEVVRIYLPPDANCLLSVADHCLRSRNYVNVIVAGKQPSWQWLDMDAAVRHCTAGAGIWALGQQRSIGEARRGDGLCRRRADAGVRWPP